MENNSGKNITVGKTKPAVFLCPLPAAFNALQERPGYSGRGRLF